MKKIKLYEIRYRIALLSVLLILLLAMIYIIVGGDISTDEDSSSLLPNVAYTLNNGKSLKIDRDTSIKIKSLSPMPSRCNDCFESVTLAINIAGREADLDFTFGGFAGVNTGWREVENIEVKVIEINQSSIRFEYRRKD